MSHTMKQAKGRERTLELETLGQKIYGIRNHRVMLDSDLARLYQVSTKARVQAVKRNLPRFPADFMFRLNQAELLNLRSQNVTSSWGGRRHLPYAFTEQGVAMLSSVLRSPRAVKVNIAIMRAFVRLRETLSLHRELALKFQRLEEKVEKHDQEIAAIFQAIRELMAPPELPPKPKIGFHE